MVKLLLDPAVGSQNITYDFKKDFSLTTCLPKIMEMLRIPQEDYPKYMLQFKDSGRFVSKVEELWNLKDEEEVLLRSIKNEAKVSIDELTDIVASLSDSNATLLPQQLQEYANYLNRLYKNFKQSGEYAEECVQLAALDKLLDIALVGGSTSIQLYAMEAYSYAFACNTAGLEFIKTNLEATAKVYELLQHEGLTSTVLETLAAIIEEVPKSYEYIVKAAKRMAMVQSRAPYSELVELFKTEDIDIKMRVMLFVNNMLKSAPSDKLTCRFVAQLESLNFYEYLQEASTLRCVELNQLISNFQVLAKVVIRTTQFENEALRNRVKELSLNCEKLEEKLLLFAQQQNLFDYLKDDFRSFETLARASIERATLYTPFIPLNHYSPEFLRTLPQMKKDVVNIEEAMNTGFSVNKKWINLAEKVKKEKFEVEDKCKGLEKVYQESQKSLTEVQDKCKQLEKTLEEANKKYGELTSNVSSLTKETEELKAKLKEALSRAENYLTTTRRQDQEFGKGLAEVSNVAIAATNIQAVSDSSKPAVPVPPFTAPAPPNNNLPSNLPSPPVSVPVPPVSVPTPPFSVPAPPFSVPAPPVSVPTPPVSVPTPPFSIPTPPINAPAPPFSVPTPPVSIPTPPVSVPTPPVKVPTPPFSIPTPPGTAPAPPFSVPTPPGTAPAPPFSVPTPPGTAPAPPFSVPTPPGTAPAPPFSVPTPPGTGPAPPFSVPTPPVNVPTPPFSVPTPSIRPPVNVPVPPMNVPVPPVSVPLPPGVPRPPVSIPLPPGMGGNLPTPPMNIPVPPTGNIPVPPPFNVPRPPMNGMPMPPPMMAPVMSMDPKPTKPKITLSKRVKPIPWARYIIPPKTHPLYKPTIWDEVKEVKIDQSVIESLFESGHRGATQTTTTAVAVKKPANAIKKVFSADRDKKLLISLQKMPPAMRFKELLLKLDTTEMTKDKVEVFMNVWPAEDERSQLVEEHKAEPDARWDRTESYVLHLVGIIQFESRLWVWKFILGYPEEKEFILEFSECIDSAFKCLKTNKAIRTILGIILSLGNILNGGTVRGQADGFNIETLGRLSNLTDNNKKTVLHFVVDKLKEMDPEISIKKEFEPVFKAQRMNIKDLGNKVKTLSEGFKGLKLRNESLSKIIKDPEDTFLQVCGKFINDTEPEIKQISESYKKLNEEYTSICEMYRISSEDEKAKNTEELFNFFGGFFEKLNKICSEEKKKPKRMPEIVKKQPINLNRSAVPLPIKRPEETKSPSTSTSPAKKPEEKPADAKPEPRIPQTQSSVTSALARLKMAHARKGN